MKHAVFTNDDEREYWNERTAVYEHVAGMTKAEAERRATEDLEQYRGVCDRQGRGD